MKKRIELFIKTYFYFNSNEIKGIYVLIGLIIGVLCLKWSLPFLFPPVPFQISMRTLIELDSLSDIPAGKNYSAYKNFDYRQFTSTNHKDARVASFVKYKRDTVYPSSKKKIIPVIELNETDSASLVKLYRIGPVMASRIIAYRNKLRGFINLSQLTEIYGFDADILYDLDGKIIVNEKLSLKYDLNMVSLEDLKCHPYFKNNLSQAIINYRNLHGKFRSFDDLKPIKLVNDSIIERIKPYSFMGQ